MLIGLLAQEPTVAPAYPPELAYWIGLSVVAGAVILRLGEAAVKIISEWSRGRKDIITAQGAADVATVEQRSKANRDIFDAATTLLGIYTDRINKLEGRSDEQGKKIDSLEEAERKCRRQVGRLMRVLIQHDLMKAVDPDSDDPPSPVPASLPPGVPPETKP